MCGICGIVGAGPLGPGDAECVARMSDAIAHRGPDGSGRWSDDHAAFGHRRLAVIDPSGGRQPLVDDELGLVLTYNGEVYNFRDLRRELAARGHVFRSDCDTEVVLRGYAEWGDRVVERLRGMFAFALWEAGRRRLLLVRDRLGVKPLYVTQTPDGRVLFASEIKALLMDPAVPRAVNAPRLAEHTLFRGLCGEETLFAGIFEVEAGTLAVREGDGPLVRRRYWTASVPMRASTEVGTAAELRAEARDLLVDAVASRLVSDVPLGAITSGGIDSSLVSAIAAERSPEGFDTFCVGFDDPAADERPYARAAADHMGSVHHDVEIGGAEVARDIDMLAWANDEPLTQANTIGLHLVCRHAKESAGVTVLLCGEGGDEVFGGYWWHRRAAQSARVRSVPGLHALHRALPPAGRLARLRESLDREWLMTSYAAAEPALVQALVRDTGSDPLATRRAVWPVEPGRRDDMLVFDQRAYLKQMFHRLDRMSMAAAVEVREPLVDQHVVEWANALPIGAKVPGGVTKAILRDVAAEWLPAAIIDRRKVGFAAPDGVWMRPGQPLAERVDALADPGSGLARLTDTTGVARVVAEHRSGRADHRQLLWRLLSLDAWSRTFLGPELAGRGLPGALLTTAR